MLPFEISVWGIRGKRDVRRRGGADARRQGGKSVRRDARGRGGATVVGRMRAASLPRRGAGGRRWTGSRRRRSPLSLPRPSRTWRPGLGGGGDGRGGRRRGRRGRGRRARSMRGVSLAPRPAGRGGGGGLARERGKRGGPPPPRKRLEIALPRLGRRSRRAGAEGTGRAPRGTHVRPQSRRGPGGRARAIRARGHRAAGSKGAAVLPRGKNVPRLVALVAAGPEGGQASSRRLFHRRARPDAIGSCCIFSSLDF